MRRYRLFVCKDIVEPGTIIQNTPEAKQIFEDMKRRPMYGLMKVRPKVPMFLANTWPSRRSALALMDPSHFAKGVCVGVARRLPNGTGYRCIGYLIGDAMSDDEIMGILATVSARQSGKTYPGIQRRSPDEHTPVPDALQIAMRSESQ
jgi:hypothetical protein